MGINKNHEAKPKEAIFRV